MERSEFFFYFVLQVVSNAVTLMESSDIVWAHLHEVEMFSRGLFRLAPFPSCFYLRFKTNLGSHPFILKRVFIARSMSWKSNSYP